jgi:EAL domain-containing protein (putative c-di-GMP-specific phosphodiesterase class I)
MRVVSREPEAHLIELLQLVEDAPQGWQMVAFHFNKLLEHYRSEYQIKIATNLMNDLLGDRDGAIYLCEDSTIYVMVKNFPRQLTEKMVFQLRYLFMDDPLSYTAEGDENPAFSSTHDLESQWQEVMAMCKRRLVSRVRLAQGGLPRAVAIAAAEEMTSAIAAKKEAKGVKPSGELRAFTASSLATIERDMLDVDLTSAIRRQPVCAAIPENPIRTVFDEMYINISHLRQSMGIEVDLLSNRWLFKYLTQILDNRMLDMIQRNPVRHVSTPISLNLNIPTLLSSRFTEFDGAIKPSSKGSIVIELQIADVFADMAAFLLAKDTVQKLGYRVCLDGVTELSLPQIDRQRLGFDLVKLIWNSDGEQDASTPKNIKLAEAVRACGNNRVILTRCDTKQAVQYGQALGITLFQGRYLDGLVHPKAVVKN